MASEIQDLADVSDDNSSSIGMSHGTSSGTEHGEDSKNESVASEVKPIALGETQAVHRTKQLVYLVFFLAASSVCLATYFLLSKAEEGDFEVQVRVYVWIRQTLLSSPLRIYLFMPTVQNKNIP